MAAPPVSGEQWNAQNERFRGSIEDAAAAFGVPVQILLNMGRMESDWNPNKYTASSQAAGLFQFTPGTTRWLNQQWGTNYDPYNPDQAAQMAARFLYENATGTGVGNVTINLGTREDPNRVNAIPDRSVTNPNWEFAVGGYHGGHTGYMEFLAGQDTTNTRNLGPVNAGYTVRALLGYTPINELSEQAQRAYHLHWPGQDPSFIGPPNPNFGWTDQGNVPGFQQGNLSQLSPEVQERLQQGMDFLDAWAVSDPSKATAIEGLAAGPGAYQSGDFPWTRGQVSQPYGEALQYYGYMPSNLRFNAQTGNWDPTAAPVSTEGPWGTAALSNWVQDSVSDPNVSAGQRWYVQQLGGSAAPPGGLETWDASPWGVSGGTGHGNTNWTLGLGQAGEGGALGTFSPGSGGGANVATAGIDIGNWLGNWASRYFGSTPEQVRGAVYDPSRPTEFWDATPGVNVLGRPFSDSPNVYDASGQPMQDPPVDNGVLNWLPAGGTWGTPGGVSPNVGIAQQQLGEAQGMFFNPALGNWGTFSGGTGNAVTDYNDWYNKTLGNPPAGFNPVGTVDTSATSTIDPGGPGYGAALNPVFAGMYYSQVPTNIWSNTAASNTLQQQMAAQAAAAQQQLAQQNAILQASIQAGQQPTYGAGTPYLAPGVVRTGLEMFGT